MDAFSRLVKNVGFHLGWKNLMGLAGKASP